MVIEHSKANDGSVNEDWLKKVVFDEGLGIVDATDDEIRGVTDALEGGTLGGEGWLDVHLANCSSTRAQVGWATHGHSGVDVVSASRLSF